MAGIFLRSRGGAYSLPTAPSFHLTPAKISGNSDCLLTPYTFSIERSCIASPALLPVSLVQPNYEQSG